MKTFNRRRAAGLALALATGASLALAANTAEAPHRLAIMSFVGDSIDVVTYEGQTGRLTEANDHASVPFTDAGLDLVALKAASEAAHTAEPQDSVATLSASEPALFAGQKAWFDGDQARLPDEITAAAAREHADQLLLVTKYRGTADIRMKRFSTGAGHLEGMGFYVDTQLPVRRSDTGERGRGYIAPFAYLELTLVDVASGKVLRQSHITESYSISAARNQEGLDPWGALTPAQKVATMRRLLDRQVRKAVPGLLAPQAGATAVD